MNGKNLVMRILFQMVASILVGLLFINSMIINPGTTLFTYSIFAFYASVLFYVLRDRGYLDFTIVGIIIAGIVLYFWHKNPSIEVLVRNLLWYDFIAAAVIVIHKLLPGNGKENKVIKILSIWTITFLMVYLFMFGINIYIISTYPLTDSFSKGTYFMLAVKFGLCLGFGLGAGHLLNKVLLEKSDLSWR